MARLIVVSLILSCFEWMCIVPVVAQLHTTSIPYHIEGCLKLPVPTLDPLPRPRWYIGMLASAGGSYVYGIPARDMDILGSNEANSFGVVSSLGLNGELALQYEGGWASRSLVFQLDIRYRTIDSKGVWGYLLGKDSQNHSVLIPVTSTSNVKGVSVSTCILLKERLFYNQLFAVVGFGGEIWTDRRLFQAIEGFPKDNNTRLDSIVGYVLADSGRVLTGNRQINMLDVHTIAKLGITYDFHVQVLGLGWLKHYNPLHVSPFVYLMYDFASFADEDEWRTLELVAGIELGLPIGR